MRRSALPLALAACLAGAAGVDAAVIHVETLIVATGSFPPCELDEAIESANTDFPVGGCDNGDGADVIRFDVEGTIELPAELPAVTEALTIEGPGADRLTIDGQDQSRILSVAGVALTIQGATLARGAAAAGDGGALRIQTGADVVLRDCRVTASAAENGGGVDADQATVRVERCLIDGNAASAAGGGLRNRGGEVEIVDTTLSGNVAAQGGGIAGVDAGSPGTTALYSVTLAGNEAVTGANVFVGGGSEIAARQTIFALPVAGDDCDGPITSLDWNLADDASCALAGGHDQEGVAAGLAALADNGGPTLTRALQPGSAAIDAGDLECRDGAGVELLTDQRGPGFLRRVDGDDVPGSYCDIGAYEAPEPGAAATGVAAALALAALARRRQARVP